MYVYATSSSAILFVLFLSFFLFVISFLFMFSLDFLYFLFVIFIFPFLFSWFNLLWFKFTCGFYFYFTVSICCGSKIISSIFYFFDVQFVPCEIHFCSYMYSFLFLH
jgi:hypothetical protein